MNGTKSKRWLGLALIMLGGTLVTCGEDEPESVCPDDPDNDEFNTIYLRAVRDGDRVEITRIDEDGVVGCVVDTCYKAARFEATWCSE